MRKKVVLPVVLIGGLYLIVVLSRDLWQVLGSRSRISEAEEQVKILEKEQREFKDELERVNADGFVEKEARDKLLLAKEGEVVLLLPQQQNLEVRDDNLEEDQKELENWEKWWNLFF